jgi:signal transduction histidine kinase
MTRRTLLIYGLLAAVWVLVMAWLSAEHFRVRRSARAALINRAKDISTTLGIVVRSQRHFGGVISKERLESALKDLVGQGDLSSVAMLNATGAVVASAGLPSDLHARVEVRTEPLWEDRTVTLMNLVDLGSNVGRDSDRTNPPIVLSRQELFRPFETNRPAGTNTAFRTPPRRETDAPGPANPPPPPPDEQGRRPGAPDGRPRLARPFWMSEEEYKAVIQKQGVHSFVIVMSTQSVRAVCKQDLWLRSIIGVFATVSVVGSGLSWRNLLRSSELQLRLVRAKELNTHLKEMNLAAAGLAHETRNPLNIIRGLAQMVSKQEDAAPETRKKAREIVDEADRVTAQLNGFIDYSRPREVRRTRLTLGTVVGEVVRALGCDLEEKKIRLQVAAEQVVIEADEQLLRQALFNLLLNAIQAVDSGGEIRIVAHEVTAAEACLEIRDDGPGVPPDRRKEIFKPYVTTSRGGTGLGLAVVQQIVLAHGWEIECLGNEPHGAILRISHLTLAPQT